MSSLNNSVIICDASPKSTRRKTSMGTKKAQKKVKRTFYESPLTHITLSRIRWEQARAQKRLFRRINRFSRRKRKPLVSGKDQSLQDSVIILSDNDCESNARQDKNKCKKNVRTQEASPRILRKKRDSQISLASNESFDGEPRLKKRRKTNGIALSDNNSSCLLISDTEDSDVATVYLDDENIAPASESVNQGTDDIVVVWSSTKTPSPTGDELKENTNRNKDNRLFMIDPNPDLNNLGCLESNEVITPEPCKNNVEKKNDTQKEKEDPNCKEKENSNYKEKENSNYKEKENSNYKEKENSNYKEKENADYLPFSKKGLKLPKAHNISKKLKVKKANKLKNFKRQATASATHTIPVICNLQTVATASTSNETSTTLPISETCGSGLRNTQPDEFQAANRLREIVIDGNNVAMAHKNGKKFSESGLMIVIDYFKHRGHSVKVFVPQHRRSLTHPLLEKLHTDGIVVFTPSRSIGGRWITPYDDRYILEYATMCGGVVVSSDQYRDLYMEKPEWRDTIENRLLAPTFVGDYVMFPEDPLGRNGPKLEDFLRY